MVIIFHRDYFFKGTCSSFLGTVQSVKIHTENHVVLRVDLFGARYFEKMLYLVLFVGFS